MSACRGFSTRSVIPTAGSTIGPSISENRVHTLDHGENLPGFCVFFFRQAAKSAAMIIERTARSALREATHPYHESIDTLFSSARLGERASYGQFLLAQAAAHLPTEDALTRGGVAAIVSDWPARQRGDLLRSDLHAMGLAVPQPAGVPVLGNPSALLGALYVLEGSRLGGSLLRRSVPSGFPAGFLSGGNSAAWRGFLGLLETHLNTHQKRNVAIKAACDVFVLFETSGKHHLKAAPIV